MDIKDIQSSGPSPLEPSRRAASSQSAAQGGTPDQPVDRITMSDEAQAFQNARRAALAVPEVRLDRVEALRQQYAAGELTPDPDAIARALVAQKEL